MRNHSRAARSAAALSRRGRRRSATSFPLNIALISASPASSSSPGGGPIGNEPVPVNSIRVASKSVPPEAPTRIGFSFSPAGSSRDTDVAGPVPGLFPVRSVPFAPFLVGFFPFVLLALGGIFRGGSQQVRLSWLRLIRFRTRPDQVTEQAVEEGTEAKADPPADVNVCG